MIVAKEIDFSYSVGGFRLRVDELQVGRGEKVGLIGPSGCGKTTLLGLLAGILVPTTGRIDVGEVDVASLKDEDRQDYRALTMGLIFQEFELLEYLDLLDNVLLPYRISPVLALDAAVRERAETLIGAVGLSGKNHQYPRRLSQGERQRIAVCRALVTRPTVLFGDEPTSNLDPANRDHILDMLWEYCGETGAPIVMVTHDHEILARFDRTIDMGGWSA